MFHIDPYSLHFDSVCNVLCVIVYILGLDLSDANQPGQVFSLSTDTSLDTGRKSFNLRGMLKIGQQSLTAIEQV